MSRFRRLIAGLGAGALVLTGCSPAEVGTSWKLPPAGVGWDYQIGGVREPDPEAEIVIRDRNAASAGRYDICYVNGFQTQPDEARFWQAHPRLVLRRHGRPVVDSDWGEWLLDIRTAARRARLAEIVGGWIDGCAAAGYEAVEFDNLDSWTRSGRLLKRRQALAYARLLTARAHRNGLAAAQKNAAGLGSAGPATGFDFAIAEECGRYRECEAYRTQYGDRVLVVEYRRADFDAACARWGASLGILLRDRAVSPDGITDRC